MIIAVIWVGGPTTFLKRLLPTPGRHHIVIALSLLLETEVAGQAHLLRIFLISFHLINAIARIIFRFPYVLPQDVADACFTFIQNTSRWILQELILHEGAFVHLSLERFKAHLVIGWRGKIDWFYVEVRLRLCGLLILLKFLMQRRSFHYFIAIEHN